MVLKGQTPDSGKNTFPYHFHRLNFQKKFCLKKVYHHLVAFSFIDNVKFGAGCRGEDLGVASSFSVSGRLRYFVRTRV